MPFKLQLQQQQHKNNNNKTTTTTTTKPQLQPQLQQQQQSTKTTTTTKPQLQLCESVDFKLLIKLLLFLTPPISCIPKRTQKKRDVEALFFVLNPKNDLHIGKKTGHVLGLEIRLDYEC